MGILNDRIKEMRNARGLTLIQVAEKLGVKEATMQRYESGEIKNIKHETITALADIFNCSPSYLMGWDEEQQQDDDTQKLLQAFKDRPAAHMLFSKAATATDDDIIRAAKFLEAMQKTDEE
jgi:transcriptional regulator with XRE-family HTH domain